MDRVEINKRYPKLTDAVWRGWNEIHYAINCRMLLVEIFEPGHEKISSRKGLIFSALDDNVRMRLARLLEANPRSQTAGFPYVRGCVPQLVDELAQRNDVDLDKLDDLARRLKMKRDRTLFHIDKRTLGNAAEIWNDDRITYAELDEGLSGLKVIYAGLHRKLTGTDAPFFELHGDLPSHQPNVNSDE